MAPLLEFLAVGAAVVAAVVAGLSLLVKRQGKAEVETKELKSLVREWRAPGGLFDEATKIVSASKRDPWVVVEPNMRYGAGCILEELRGGFTAAPSRRIWIAALNSAQSKDLSDFLKAVAPLVWMVRGTSLQLAGKAVFWNGHRKSAAKEIYRVLSVDFDASLKVAAPAPPSRDSYRSDDPLGPADKEARGSAGQWQVARRKSLKSGEVNGSVSAAKGQVAAAQTSRRIPEVDLLGIRERTPTADPEESP
jgi:hypothetical protein